MITPLQFSVEEFSEALSLAVGQGSRNSTGSLDLPALAVRVQEFSTEASDSTMIPSAPGHLFLRQCSMWAADDGVQA